MPHRLIAALETALSDDRMFNGGQKLTDVIILGYLGATLVPIHFSRHHVGYIWASGIPGMPRSIRPQAIISASLSKISRQ